MLEKFGDLWEFHRQPNTVACITTNGFVKTNGQCVMGRGCAQQARDKFPGTAALLGDLIKAYGNHVHYIGNNMLAFPTKHVWWEKSDLQLISKSAQELELLALVHPDITFYLPRPGCANGQLNWSDVKPVLGALGLPDNVIVITNDSTQM